jgi:hypothetical protein
MIGSFGGKRWVFFLFSEISPHKCRKSQFNSLSIAFTFEINAFQIRRS